MSAYLNKAHNNVDTAKLLVDNDCLNSSAHPAYYSAFLYLKYVLAHHKDLDYGAQDAMTKGKDSHNTISNIALPFMAQKDTATGSDYLVWYNKLKKMRKRADYVPESISADYLKDNLAFAVEFMNHVEAFFKVA